jgi:hypothetical protein
MTNQNLDFSDWSEKPTVDNFPNHVCGFGYICDTLTQGQNFSLDSFGLFQLIWNI